MAEGYPKDIWNNYVTVSTTRNSITVYVSPAVAGIFDNPGANWYQLSLNGSRPSGIRSTGTSYTYTGLDSGTGYLIIIDVLYSGHYSSNWGTDSGFEYTDSAPAIDPWYWNYAELNAFNNKGNFSVLTAARWNSFIDRINEAATQLSWGWDNSFASLAGTKAYSGQTLTAAMFNSARYNVDARYSTNLPVVSKGDTIYGWYFITLQDKLNAWIASS